MTQLFAPPRVIAYRTDSKVLLQQLRHTHNVTKCSTSVIDLSRAESSVGNSLVTIHVTDAVHWRFANDRSPLTEAHRPPLVCCEAPREGSALPRSIMH